MFLHYVEPEEERSVAWETGSCPGGGGVSSGSERLNRYPWLPPGSGVSGSRLPLFPRRRTYSDCEQYSSDESMSSDSSEEFPEVPIWIGGVQKFVTGITRRTTCDDVIYALLCQDKNPHEDIKVENFAIFERWREMEKPLRGRTKIMKVWRAWGAERHNVRFFVRKYDNLLDSSMEVSRQRRPRKQHRDRGGDRPSVTVDHGRDTRHKSSRSHSNKNKQSRSGRDKHQQYNNHHHHQQQHQQQLQQQQQQQQQQHKSVHYEDANPYQSVAKQQQEDQYKSKEFHELVHRILEQERKIQDQLCRVHEMDIQIENYETKIHVLRMQQNGANYVQDAYLKDHTDSSSGGEELPPGLRKNGVTAATVQAQELEQYLTVCDSILQMEDKLVNNQEKIQDLSIQIQEQSILIPDPEEDANPQYPTSEDIKQQFDAMKHELRRCASLSSAQQTQMELVKNTLVDCETQLGKKSEHINELMRELDDMDNEVYVDDVPHVYNTNANSPTASPTPTPAISTPSPQGGVAADRPTVSPLAGPNSGQLHPVSLPPPGGQDYVYSTARETAPNWAFDPSGHLGRPEVAENKLIEGFTHYTDTRRVITQSSGQLSCRLDKGSEGIMSVYGNSDQLLYNKHISDNDSNSDTGLSSLHSDEAGAVLETLV